jgi:hypothetical protein
MILTAEVIDLADWLLFIYSEPVEAAASPNKNLFFIRSSVPP